MFQSDTVYNAAQHTMALFIIAFLGSVLGGPVVTQAFWLMATAV